MMAKVRNARGAAATYRGEGGEDDAGKKDSWKKRASALDFLLESMGDIPKLEGSGADPQTSLQHSRN